MLNLANGSSVKLPASYGPFPFWIIEDISEDGQVLLSTDDGHEITISVDELAQFATEI